MNTELHPSGAALLEQLKLLVRPATSLSGNVAVEHEAIGARRIIVAVRDWLLDELPAVLDESSQGKDQ